MRDLAPLEQLAIARQHDAAVGLRQIADLLVADRIAVEGVEPQHAQQPRQAAEMRVGDEAHLAQRLSPHPQQRPDVEALELRVDADSIRVAHQIGEVHRLAIDQDQLDLGMRNAQRLDRVLDRGGACAAVLDVALAQCRRKEIVQLLVEAEPRDGAFGR